MDYFVAYHQLQYRGKHQNHTLHLTGDCIHNSEFLLISPTFIQFQQMNIFDKVKNQMMYKMSLNFRCEA